MAHLSHCKPLSHGHQWSTALTTQHDEMQQILEWLVEKSLPQPPKDIATSLKPNLAYQAGYATAMIEITTRIREILHQRRAIIEARTGARH